MDTYIQLRRFYRRANYLQSLWFVLRKIPVLYGCTLIFSSFVFFVVAVWFFITAESYWVLANFSLLVSVLFFLFIFDFVLDRAMLQLGGAALERHKQFRPDFEYVRYVYMQRLVNSSQVAASIHEAIQFKGFEYEKRFNILDSWFLTCLTAVGVALVVRYMELNEAFFSKNMIPRLLVICVVFGGFYIWLRSIGVRNKDQEFVKFLNWLVSKY